jgi:outer membrane lipoprotein-sorting protein
MKPQRNLPLAALLLTATAPLALAQTPANLTTVLAQMDKSSKTYQSAEATVQYDNYTRVVRAHDLQSGTIFIERSGGASDMGAVFYESSTDGKPTTALAKVLNYDGGTLLIYTPGTKQVDVFKAGANQAKYESFLTLGFGGSGTDLAKAWNIQDDGPEMIDGIKTEKLELTSKDPSVSSMFKTVTIWIDPARDISLKQLFLAPNNDSRTAIYSNIKLNPSHIDKKPYAISKSATRISH